MSANAEKEPVHRAIFGAAEDIPVSKEALRAALIAQREYTLAIYQDLPPAYWEPAKFPYLLSVNPPLWELAHIAWFAEFFCLRWKDDDIEGHRTPSIMACADALFNSQTVPHRNRWSNVYPNRVEIFDYMKHSLVAVLDGLAVSARADRYGFQLALVHEDMHAEALAMTLTTLGLPMAPVVATRQRLASDWNDDNFGGGIVELGACERSFQFDNELPVCRTRVEPFSIASRPVSASEFAEFADSRAYSDRRYWSDAGNAWRDCTSQQRVATDAQTHGQFAAMHVNYFEAEAWCNWAGRRLPREAEWEFAATHSAEFRASTGHVWEWCASEFVPYPGFSAARYRDYSAPWFHTHQVLRGGSFVTHARLTYPQYRNFYTKERRDMFCGFRTCALG